MGQVEEELAQELKTLYEGGRARDLAKSTAVKRLTTSIYKGLPDQVSKYGHEANIDGQHAAAVDSSKTAPASKKSEAHRNAEAAHAHAAERIKNYLAHELGDKHAASEHPAVKMHRQGAQWHHQRATALGDHAHEAKDIDHDIMTRIDKAPYHAMPLKGMTHTDRTLASFAARKGKVVKMPAKGRFPERYVVTPTGSHKLGTFDQVRNIHKGESLDSPEDSIQEELEVSSFKRLAGLSEDYQDWTHQSEKLEESAEPVEVKPNPIRRLARMLQDEGFNTARVNPSPKK